MKIGILSMQRVVNYGSFLQAHALRKIVESLGHTVSFVDIQKGRDLFGPEKTHTGKRKYILDQYIFRRIEHVLYRRKRKQRFSSEFFPSIGIDNPVHESECDMVVVGSDEVFNCCQPARWGFSTQLLGEIECSAISYAGSFGYTTLDMISQFGIEKEVTAALGKFEAISVRDRHSAQCVEMLTGCEPQQHLDPVFVYDWKDEVRQQTKYNNYILIYSYDNRINDPAEIQAIKNFAKKHNKQLISFGLYQRWCDKNIMCSPFELLAYFDAADYVITDTFHGTVIAIKRNKQFATLVRESNRNKLSDVLEKFDLNNRQVVDVQELENILLPEINYEMINEKIEAESEKTRLYLRENLR